MLDQLLAQPLDAVVIASPDALHREQMLAAFAKGLHVFCEKPLCYGADDIDESSRRATGPARCCRSAI